MSAQTTPTPQRPGAQPGAARKLIVIVVGLAALVTVMLCAFALPGVKGGPHSVPIGVTASQTATHKLDQALDPGHWDVTHFADADALTSAVQDRDIVGGLVLTADGVDIYTATAGAPSAASALTAEGEAIAGRQHVKAGVYDLAPFPHDDPRGAGLSAVALPMILGGVFTAILLSRPFPGHRGLRTRVVGVLAFSLVAGAALTAFLQFATHTLDGNYALTALGFSLGMAALAMTFIGLASLIGIVGIAGGGAVMMLLGNPLSALTTGPHWLPAGWSTLGQILPPGATGSLLRANGYFQGTGASTPALTLTAWVLLGLALLFIANRRGNKTTPIPARTAASEEHAVAAGV